MDANGEGMDHCLVGEPTCPETMGEMMKIGRRGSMTLSLTASGMQGHAAYPHRARNPLPPLVALLDRLATWRLDEGTAQFDPSTLAITTVDTGNPASNVIPGEAKATVNIRFNDAHSSGSIEETVRAMLAEAAMDGVTLDMQVKVSGESFVTEPDAFTALLRRTVTEETGIEPDLSTSGGTSDARFVRRMCPVVEFGLVGQTMHKADEHVAVEDIRSLARIYARIIGDYKPA
jgi:succinyl-diaminopimelate desuccinylase